MKNLFVLLFMLLFTATMCFAQALADSTAVFSIGSFHFTWPLIIAMLAAIEGILRALPSGKYASILGIIHWLDNLIPSNDKPPADKK